MSETWVLLAAGNSFSFYNTSVQTLDASFISNGQTFSSIKYRYASNSYWYIDYDDTWVYDNDDRAGWRDDAYRTIVLDSPATGDLLTWLQANGTKQEETDIYTINLTVPNGINIKVGGKYVAEDIKVIPKLEDEKTITPSTSQQTATPEEGYIGLKKVIVNAIATEEKTVDLAMASGNQTVNADEGKAMSQVTITKPATMLPENIKKDVNIGGVVGAFAGGASLNIAYGDTPPTDTTKLWIKAAQPANIKIDPEITGSEVMSSGVASLPTAAYFIAAAAVGIKVYLFGGTTNGASDRYAKNTINVFDTETNSISTLSATLPTAANGIAAAAVGTKIYLFGGGGSSGFLNTINVFDTTTNTISTLSVSLPKFTRGIAAAAVGKKVYLFGGYGKASSNADYLNTINVFDTETNSISTLSATLPTAANGIAAAAVGKKVYLFGGYGKASSNVLNTINVFDTETNSISTSSATLPTAANGIAAAAVGKKIYLFGGGGSNVLNTINVFDTETNSISTSSATLPTAANGIAAAAVGTKIYLFGGGGSSVLNTINVFIFVMSLSNGNVQIASDTETNLFAIVATDTMQMRVGIINVYKGNSSNVAELCDAYLYNGTDWINVNTGEKHSTGAAGGDAQ